MRKTISDAKTASGISSNKNDKPSQSIISKKRFEAYNKSSKAKADQNAESKPEKVFEYYYDEYDEYLSS